MRRTPAVDAALAPPGPSLGRGNVAICGLSLRLIHPRPEPSEPPPITRSTTGQDAPVPPRTAGRKHLESEAPHEFESRTIRQCLTGRDVEGPLPSQWGPSTRVVSVLALGLNLVGRGPRDHQPPEAISDATGPRATQSP
jgi:hypothetical protein